ncbi:craniofacial development protein 2-like [Penaeus monodon]|uniref:craniofacial development protein 2-like n=1 Tax=Penaeus monodon TaxID=6687 RepID=UPI0018A72623|nr:craniofacial development protein 2-like [Penaeus monodon]
MAKKNICIGTWNVRSLKDEGKLEVLVNEISTISWNVVGVSELRWTGIGETSTDDGHKLWYSEFAKRHHLVVANTLHNHKLSRRTTWHSPDGVTHNQIDYILVDRRFQTGINRPKTRTLKKTDIGSDHDPVMMTFRMRHSKEKKVSQRCTKFDLEKLKDREVAEKYRSSQMAGRFAPLLLLTNEEPQQLCDQFTDITFNTANEILGKARPIKRPRITPEILQKCEERRELKKNRFTNNESLGQYRKANKEVKRAIIKAKDNWVEKQAEDIEQSLAVNNSRKA